MLFRRNRRFIPSTDGVCPFFWLIAYLIVVLVFFAKNVLITIT
jgi:hypothetical protein